MLVCVGRKIKLHAEVIKRNKYSILLFFYLYSSFIRMFYGALRQNIELHKSNSE